VSAILMSKQVPSSSRRGGARGMRKRSLVHSGAGGV
jgi:hypothetical protein